MTSIEEIKELLKKDEIEKTFQEIEKLLVYLKPELDKSIIKNLESELINHQGDYNDLIRQDRQNQIKREDYRVEKTEIRKRLLSFLDELEEEIEKVNQKKVKLENEKSAKLTENQKLQEEKELEEKRIKEAENQRKIEENKKLEAQKQKELQEKLNAKEQKTNGKKAFFANRRFWLGGGLVGLLGLFLMKGQCGNSDESLITPSDTTKKTEINENNLDTISKIDSSDKTLAELLPKMIFVQGGTFQMGSNNGEDDEKPVHQVTLSDFYVAETEVTQELYEKIMGTNPSHFQNCPQCPVEQVSWDDVQVFIRKLNKLTGKTYRLPTEAEWEYAARGGNQSQNYVFVGSNQIAEVAWYEENSGSKTHPVKTKKTNELGIYDMSGNVWEWCEDDYDMNFYQTLGKSAVNPLNNKNRASNPHRVVRGGSWYSDAYLCRISDRSYFHLGLRDDDRGFRLFVRVS